MDAILFQANKMGAGDETSVSWPLAIDLQNCKLIINYQRQSSYLDISS